MHTAWRAYRNSPRLGELWTPAFCWEQPAGRAAAPCFVSWVPAGVPSLLRKDLALTLCPLHSFCVFLRGGGIRRDDSDTAHNMSHTALRCAGLLLLAATAALGRSRVELLRCVTFTGTQPPTRHPLASPVLRVCVCVLVCGRGRGVWVRVRRDQLHVLALGIPPS